MNLKKLLTRVLQKYTKEKPTKRYIIRATTYAEFSNEEDRSAHIKQQLLNNGFDVTKEIDIYRGVNNDRYLYEQRG